VQKVAQNAQTHSLSNTEVDTKSSAWRKMTFLKHRAENLAQTIPPGLSGPRVITEFGSPVNETLLSFVDRR
jgi:hypothetical protein